MEINEYLKDQKQIFWDLLAATVLELDRYPDILKGDFVFGANDTVLSFRNCGKGFLPGVIVKAILPDVEGEKADGHMSDLYPMEALLTADVFELHSFHDGKTTALKCEKGELTELRVYPDWSTPQGLLIHLEWSQGLPEAQLLKKKDVASAMRRVFSGKAPLPKMRWKPTVWFNGERVMY